MGDVWIATNASVNSLASFHAVMGPRAVYSANLYIQLSYRSGCSINLKLRELIIACSTLCRNRLCCLPTWYYTQSSLKFGTALGGRGGGGGGGGGRGAPEPVPQVPRPQDQCWKQNLSAII